MSLGVCGIDGKQFRVGDRYNGYVVMKCEYGEDAGGLRAKKTGKREGS